MNCITCGKKIVAGYALCGECGKHLGDGITQTRLGHFVQHPEELAAVLSSLPEPWCKRRMEFLSYVESPDYDESVQDAKCRRCALDWLMEVV